MLQLCIDIENEASNGKLQKGIELFSSLARVIDRNVQQA